MVRASAAGFAVAVVVAGVPAVAAAGAPPLSKQQYVAMLKRANARVGKVETAAEQGLTPKASRARVQQLILAWARTETRLGTEFGAVRPPAAVVAANKLLARGEITFGGELAAAANHLPKNKAAIGPYLEGQLKHATGAGMIDRALARLRKAGYRA